MTKTAEVALRELIAQAERVAGPNGTRAWIPALDVRDVLDAMEMGRTEPHGRSDEHLMECLTHGPECVR